MALVNVGPILYPDPNRFMATAISTSANYQINGSGQRTAWVFPVHRSGTCTKAGIRISTAATPQTCRLGLYTVDGSGNPTTTLYGGSNYATFSPTANTYHEVTLGTSATMVAGEFAALVLEFDSTAGDLFASYSSGSFVPWSLGYSAKHNGTSWSKPNSGAMPLGHLYYSDAPGAWVDIGAAPYTGAQATATYNVNTGSADEYAIRLTLPFACRVAGMWHNFATAAGADYEAILYADTSPLATRAMDGDYANTTTFVGVRIVYFASPPTVPAGTTLRASIRPTTTANVTYRRFPLFAAGMAEAIGLPQDACESTRLDQGAWSDVTTNLPSIGLILDQIDDGRISPRTRPLRAPIL